MNDQPQTANIDEFDQSKAEQFDTGLASLCILLKFLHIGADAAQLKHQAGKGSDLLDAADIVRLAKSLEVKARLTSSSLKKVCNLPLPALGLAKDGRFFILAQASDSEVLIQHPADQAPQKLTYEEFAGLWSGRIILMTTRAQIAGGKRKFDVTWFIPPLVRYRHILRDVLIASFFLQLFALMSPLFFQVIVDKVLVHKGLTTLDVMILALITVSVFEIIMGGLRTYIFSHTTNRVDV